MDLERGGYRPNDIDTRTLVTNVVRGANGYDITAAFTNEVIGGRVSLQAQVSNTVVKTIPFFIRGKNPTDNVASNYISTAVDPAFRDFAWMIAKHESREGTRMYNQFNPGTILPEQPNKTSGTNRWGWGMCQIDRGRTGLVTRTVYDWKTNVDQMNATLTEKASVHERFMGYYRSAYAGRPNWSDPELATTNVLGRSVTARDWSIMTLYNGTSGLESRVVSGHTIYPPVHFDSTNGRWLFSPNANDYVRKVIQDANVNPEE